MNRILPLLFFILISFNSESQKCRISPSKPGIQSNTYVIKTQEDAFSIQNKKTLTDSDLILVRNDLLKNQNVLEGIRSSKSYLCLITDNATSLTYTQSILKAPVGDYKVVAVIPESKDEIKAVFNLTEVNSNMEKQMKNVARSYRGLTKTKVISSKTEDFLSLLTSEIKNGKRGDMLMIVGHNENGQIIGPNGASIKISHLNKLLLENKRTGVILSCNTIKNADQLTNGIATTKNLDFEDINYAIRNMGTDFEATLKPNMSDLLLSISKNLNKASAGKDGKITLLFTSIGTAILMIYILTVLDDDD